MAIFQTKAKRIPSPTKRELTTNIDAVVRDVGGTVVEKTTNLKRDIKALQRQDKTTKEKIKNVNRRIDTTKRDVKCMKGKIKAQKQQSMNTSIKLAGLKIEMGATKVAIGMA